MNWNWVDFDGITLVASDGKIILTLEHGCELSKGNAKLIAAAPKMLAMLRKFEFCFDDEGSNVCPSCKCNPHMTPDSYDAVDEFDTCELAALLNEADG